MNTEKVSNGMRAGQLDAGGAPDSVSVIIPTYNRADLIARAIESVLNQSYKPSEIVVIDDCSSDDTQATINAYSGKIPLAYIRMRENCGGAVARNAGIARASGAYIAFLDSDDEWQPNHLRKLINVAAGRSDDFVVAGSALRIGKRPKVLPGREFPQRYGIADRLDFVLSAPLAFQTSTLLMPRETARRYMFDPHLRRHQDWDLIFRMIENNVAMTLLPDATIKYYAPLTEVAGNVGISRSVFPSLRFFVKHRASMSKKTKARFVALQIMRRRQRGIGTIKYLLRALVVGGLRPTEFVYYVREALTRHFAASVSTSVAVNAGASEAGK